MVAEKRIQTSEKQGDTMTELHAKPIVDGVLWVVEQNGEKVGTLHKKENNKYMLCASNGEVYFSKKSEITKRFGDDFFLKGFKTTVSHIDVNECHGYPTKWTPFNSMYDVQRRLPLFTKSNQSKSLFCAGHYIIKFPKNWVRSFCPKLITIERYPFTGPFKTEEEAKEALANVK
jgi:hypothetical protein